MAIVLNWQLGKWGAIEYKSTLGESGSSHAIAIYGLIRGFTLFIAFPIIGIMQGLMPIISFNYGAGNWSRVKETITLGLKLTFSISIVMFSILFFFPDFLIGIFTQDTDLLAHTPRVLKWIFISLPLIGVGFIGGAYFQAIGKPIPALVLTLARQVLFMIPLMLIMSNFLGLDGVWFSMPVGEILVGVWAAVWLYMEVNRLTNKKSPLDKRAFE